MGPIYISELNTSCAILFLDPFPSLCHRLPSQALGGGGVAGGLVACRTRSKRPLRDVPLGQLEAELRAPDIMPDMYDCDAVMKDRHWSEWLQGLMTSDMENDGQEGVEGGEGGGLFPKGVFAETSHADRCSLSVLAYFECF